MSSRNSTTDFTGVVNINPILFIASTATHSSIFVGPPQSTFIPQSYKHGGHFHVETEKGLSQALATKSEAHCCLKCQNKGNLCLAPFDHKSIQSASHETQTELKQDMKEAQGNIKKDA